MLSLSSHEIDHFVFHCFDDDFLHLLQVHFLVSSFPLLYFVSFLSAFFSLFFSIRCVGLLVLISF
jgi:hypothetical protein